mgnify:CR=1 FL=1
MTHLVAGRPGSILKTFQIFWNVSGEKESDIYFWETRSLIKVGGHQQESWKLPQVELNPHTDELYLVSLPQGTLVIPITSRLTWRADGASHSRHSFLFSVESRLLAAPHERTVDVSGTWRSWVAPGPSPALLCRLRRGTGAGAGRQDPWCPGGLSCCWRSSWCWCVWAQWQVHDHLVTSHELLKRQQHIYKALLF